MAWNGNLAWKIQSSYYFIMASLRILSGYIHHMIKLNIYCAKLCKDCIWR